MVYIAVLAWAAWHTKGSWINFFKRSRKMNGLRPVGRVKRNCA